MYHLCKPHGFPSTGSLNQRVLKNQKVFFHCAEKKFEAMKFLLERYKYEVLEPRMKTNIIARTIEVVIQINIVGIV